MLLPVLREAGAETTILVALGTHPPLPDAVLREHLGPAAFADGVRVLNHAWDDPDAVFSVGMLSADEVGELSGGLLAETVDLRVNKAIRDADRMIFLHPVFPHELVGFSGGSKYLFPGISGPEMIDIVHWLGALCTSGKVIGKIDTPSRRVLDGAAAKMPLPMHGLSFVYHRGEVMALEAGELREAWRRAAAISQQGHVTTRPRRYRKLLACCKASLCAASSASSYAGSIGISETTLSTVILESEGNGKRSTNFNALLASSDPSVAISIFIFCSLSCPGEN